MSCNTSIVQIIETDACAGDRKSTNCVIDPTAYPDLNLPLDSPQTQINQALLQAILTGAISLNLSFLGEYLNDAAAASAGVQIGKAYINNVTGAVTKRRV